MPEVLEPARLFEILRETVAGLDVCVQKLVTSFPLPVRVKVNGIESFRHREHDDQLLSYLKLVKIASHNNAAIVLLRSGFVQEVYALCRMIDEACTKIGSANGKPRRRKNWQTLLVERRSAVECVARPWT
jgi:hypothetical protein